VREVGAVPIVHKCAGARKVASSSTNGFAPRLCRPLYVSQVVLRSQVSCTVGSSAMVSGSFRGAALQAHNFGE